MTVETLPPEMVAETKTEPRPAFHEEKHVSEARKIVADAIEASDTPDYIKERELRHLGYFASESLAPTEED